VQAKLEGVRDLRQFGLVKVKSGVTTLEEVLAATNE
jgi:type IV pilus assembly protein PilB